MSLNKKRLRREIEADRRKKVRGRLRELRALLRAARATRRESLAGIRAQCKRAREKLRSVCATRAERASLEGIKQIDARRRELAEEKSTDKLHRDTDPNARRNMPKARVSATERRQESDDEVSSNLPRGMVPVFLKVRRQIKGSPRMSRTEAFLHWAHDNSEEVYAIQNSDAEREIAKMVREHNKHARSVGLEDVPF